MTTPAPAPGPFCALWAARCPRGRTRPGTWCPSGRRSRAWQQSPWCPVGLPPPPSLPSARALGLFAGGTTVSISHACHRWFNKRTWGYTVSILKQLAKTSAKSLCVFMCVLTALKKKIASSAQAGISNSTCSSNLVFYAQSTTAVISGRNSTCKKQTENNVYITVTIRAQ